MDFKKWYIDLKASDSLQTSEWVITFEYMKKKRIINNILAEKMNIETREIEKHTWSKRIHGF